MSGQIGLDQAIQHITATAFGPSGTPGTIGVELEWLVQDVEDPGAAVELERLAAAMPPAHHLSGRITYEPGGQLELSSRPAPNLADLIAATRADMAVLTQACAAARIRLQGVGVDPWRAPRQVLTAPRYVAMRQYLDRQWPHGQTMMCSTAAVQVCVESTRPQDYAYRWHLAHALGPVLVAAFANSPMAGGQVTGWKSTRQAVWAAIDPARTGLPAASHDPALTWAQYALDAPVMCVRGDPQWLVPHGLRLRDWLAGAGPRPIELDDIDYHLSTLFPPVRPRRWLELRMIDAQTGEDGWIVPTAVVSALMDEPAAAQAALVATQALAVYHPATWHRAARLGLSDAQLHVAAIACFQAAVRGLCRRGESAEVVEAVQAYADRHVLPGRAPADQQCAAPSSGRAAPW